MLFGYPAEATAENWFHACLVEMLQIMSDCIRTGQTIPEWPDIIPDEYRPRLRRRTSIKALLVNYQVAAMKLLPDELMQVTNALINQNNIADLLNGTRDCEEIDDLPEEIKKPIKALFEKGFDLLSDLGIRDRQYQVIFDATPFHICPFCGYEYFDGPTAPREPFDHYLAKSIYPFAAVNPRNLVPMGNKCNSKYKLAKNILFKEDGTRRKAVDPYNCESIQLSLMNSKPFEGTNAVFPLPLWQIDFEPDNEELKTWDSVFDIKQRYQRDVLDVDFMSLLTEFSVNCKRLKIKIDSQQNIIQALNDFSEYWGEMGMKDKAFIKRAVFEMLYHHCQQGNQRLIDIICGVVVGGMSLNA